MHFFGLHRWTRPLQSAVVFCFTWAVCGLAQAGPCPADLNNDNSVGVPDLLLVINTWGACPMPCPPSCAADLSGDCVVGVPDLLNVINNWGACPCSPAGPEPNDSCASFTTLATVGSNQLIVYSAANLHSGTDVDIYRISAQETDATCSCCDGGFCFDEDFRLTIRLTVPAGSSVPFQLCSGPACATVTTQCTNINPGTTGQLVWTFDGACPGVDSYEVFVRIRAQGSDVGCSNYTLTYEFEPGCF